MLAAAASTGTTTTWLDPLILAIIISSVIFGAFRGLLRSAAGLLGLVLGALFAGRLAALLDPALSEAHVQHPPIAGGVAFVIAFLIIVTAVELAANLLRIVQRMMLLGWVDLAGGAVFGLVRGVLVSMVLVAGITMLGSNSLNGTIRRAELAVFLWQNFSSMAGMLPQGMRDSTMRLVHDQVPFLADGLLPG